MDTITIGNARIELVRGDITREHVDAIVNAANSSLLGGGGVDGAIHRAGGPAILDESRTLGGCDTGDAKSTTAGRLSAKRVVHAVGPVWGRQEDGESDRLLASAYRRSLEVAAHDGCTSVAFPSIATGAYGYPVERAARVALRTVADFVAERSEVRLVRWVLFSDEDLAAYRDALREIA